jgi:DNA-directed RNA polymerase specialized sigma24 family protein
MDFVRKRIHAEILPWTGGKSYPKFDDLEQETWWLIARQIKQYAPEPETGKPFAWLRTVVHSAVVDHFRSEYSQKRDVRKEVPTDFDKDRGIANPTDPMLPPQSVHPQGAEPYGSGDPDGEEAKTRWTECAGFLSSD